MMNRITKVAVMFAILMDLAGCVTMTPVTLNESNVALLQGQWHGTWRSQFGDSGNDFQLIIDNVDTAGNVTGTRTAASPSAHLYGRFRISGKLEDGKLFLPEGTGKSAWLRLELRYDAENKEHWLTGSYSIIAVNAGGRIVTGTLDLKKVK